MMGKIKDAASFWQGMFAGKLLGAAYLGTLSLAQQKIA